MKERVAAGLTILVCAGAFLALRRGANLSPEEVIRSCFAAAKAGDSRAYFSCFGQDLLKQLRGARHESGEAIFSQGLRERAERTLGLAYSRRDDASDDIQVAVFEVETVFAERNERQEYRLQRTRGRWRITDIGPATSLTMPVPYGTPVVPRVEDTPVENTDPNGGRSQ